MKVVRAEERRTSKRKKKEKRGQLIENMERKGIKDKNSIKFCEHKAFPLRKKK